MTQDKTDTTPRTHFISGFYSTGGVQPICMKTPISELRADWTLFGDQATCRSCRFRIWRNKAAPWLFPYIDKTRAEP